MSNVRIVGNRTAPRVGLKGPTDEEIRASIESSKHAPRFLISRGVYRYRNHAEADADMDRWIVEGMVRTAKARGFAGT